MTEEKTGQKRPKKRKVSLYLPEDLIQKYMDRAKIDERSLNYMIQKKLEE